jgi:tetratricopeptide (TPR) repeat protein
LTRLGVPDKKGEGANPYLSSDGEGVSPGRKSMKFPAYVLVTLAFLGAAYPADGCTIVMVATDKVVLAGNNEDWKNPATKIWFVPASKGEYGRVCVGFDDLWVQGGMNDQGLFIDGNALAPTGWKPVVGKPDFPGSVTDRVLALCATVEDAIRLCDKYNIPGLDTARFPIADRTGASVVVEYGRGKVQYVRKTGPYQIATNFVISNLKSGVYPCRRYSIADKMLKNAREISLDLVRAVLSATHAEGQYPTVYSNICDLRNGLLYLYNFHDFEQVVAFDLAEELKKGAKTYDLPSLFPVKTNAAYIFALERTLPAAEELFKMVESRGMTKALERFFQMKALSRTVYRFDISEREINLLGYRLLTAGRTEEAIEFFKLNVSEHPQSWNTYDSLGEAYLKQGNKALAMESYRRSLELNPKNASGLEALKKLEGQK